MLYYVCICVAEAFGMIIIVFWRNCSWSILMKVVTPCLFMAINLPRIPMFMCVLLLINVA